MGSPAARDRLVVQHGRRAGAGLQGRAARDRLHTPGGPLRQATRPVLDLDRKHLQYRVCRYGALLIVIGLSFAQAAVIILLANLTFVLLGLASLQGPKTGTSVFVITRAAFGRRARLLSAFNWVTQVGFEVEGLAIAVLAGLALVVKAGGTASTGVRSPSSSPRHCSSSYCRSSVTGQS